MTLTAVPAVDGQKPAKCGRCGGLLVADWHHHTGEFLKCAACGLESGATPEKPPPPVKVDQDTPTPAGLGVALERAERMLRVAENDFERLAIAQGARAMAAAAKVLALPSIQLRAVRLQRRAERAFALANPALTPHEIGLLGGNGIKGPDLPVSKAAAHNYRVVNAGLADEDFDRWLDKAERADDLTRAKQRRFVQQLQGARTEPPPGLVRCWAEVSQPIYWALRAGRELPSTASCK